MSAARGRRRPTVLALLGVVALSGCLQVTEASSRRALVAPRGELVLELDSGLAERGERLRRVHNSGNALMRISVARHARGKILRSSGKYGYAVRLPGDSRRSSSPLAALVVRPRGEDRLTPGVQAFKWGADVRMHPRGLKKGEGSNVLQRGLFADPAQFKLQVDTGVPSCRVQGSRGAAKVVAPRQLQPREWYRLHCQLRDGRLTLRVGKAGRPGATGHTILADVGTLDFPRSVPVAVGAKVNRDGRIITASPDQFHGLLDNVFVDVG